MEGPGLGRPENSWDMMEGSGELHALNIFQFIETLEL
jgi:hypothetical protein